MSARRILHLEDDPFDAELVRACLEPVPCTVVRVAREADFLRALTDDPPDLVISDYNLSGFDGIRAFQALQEFDPTIPFLLVSGALGESRAVECLKLGMTDYILKDQLDRLPPAIERALREARERRERRAAEAEVREHQQEIEDLNRRLQRAILESHHRIKNNLQILIALVDAMRLGESADTKPESLTRLASHIRGLATLHELLTNQTSTPGASLDSVSARFALERLIPALSSALGVRNLLLDADDVTLSLKQVSAISLLVNELVSNAIKHGDGAIFVSLKRTGEKLRLAVCNDGPGFPPGFDPVASGSVGMSLIESIGTWDLEGTLSFDNTPTGARVSVLFPYLPLP